MAQSQDSSTDSTENSLENDPYYKASMDVTAVTYDELIDLIKTDPAQTIASVLHTLNAKHPAFVSNPVMMYHSHSMQDATYSSPRAIMFNGASRIFVTFNGDPSEGGYNSLEILRFDETKKDYHFREVVFKKEGTPTEKQRDEMETETDTLIVSQDNPVRCLDCHDYLSPHPTFENYLMWPGAYFSYEDVNQNYVINTLDYFSRVKVAGADPKDFAPFVEKSRYINLYKNVEREAWNLYSPGWKTDPRYSSLLFDPSNDRPANTELNQRINAYLQPLHIAHIIANHPRFVEMIDPVAIALQCEDKVLEKFFASSPQWRARLRALFARYYAGETVVGTTELKELGAKNVVLVPPKFVKVPFSLYAPGFSVHKMSAAEQQAFYRAYLDSPMVMTIFEALDQKYGSLFTHQWSLSKFGGGALRLVNEDDIQRIFTDLTDELGKSRRPIPMPASCENLESRLRPLLLGK